MVGMRLWLMTVSEDERGHELPLMTNLVSPTITSHPSENRTFYNYDERTNVVTIIIMFV